MKAVPLSIREANAFVTVKHRHSRSVGPRAKLAVGVSVRGKVVGVAILARPVARNIDHTKVIEVVRLCTDGTLHACSCLYGKMVRIARELGYEKCITYTLASEPGASLKAAGFVKEADVPAATWDRPSRRRTTMDKHLFGEDRVTPDGPKIRWTKVLTKAGS